MRRTILIATILAIAALVAADFQGDVLNAAEDAVREAVNQAMIQQAAAEHGVDVQSSASSDSSDEEYDELQDSDSDSLSLPRRFDSEVIVRRRGGMTVQCLVPPCPKIEDPRVRVVKPVRRSDVRKFPVLRPGYIRRHYRLPGVRRHAGIRHARLSELFRRFKGRYGGVRKGPIGVRVVRCGFRPRPQIRLPRPVVDRPQVMVRPPVANGVASSDESASEESSEEEWSDNDDVTDENALSFGRFCNKACPKVKVSCTNGILMRERTLRNGCKICARCIPKRKPRKCNCKAIKCAPGYELGYPARGIRPAVMPFRRSRFGVRDEDSNHNALRFASHWCPPCKTCIKKGQNWGIKPPKPIKLPFACPMCAMPRCMTGYKLVSGKKLSNGCHACPTCVKDPTAKPFPHPFPCLPRACPMVIRMCKADEEWKAGTDSRGCTTCPSCQPKDKPTKPVDPTPVTPKPKPFPFTRCPMVCCMMRMPLKGCPEGKKWGPTFITIRGQKCRGCNSCIDAKEAEKDAKEVADAEAATIAEVKEIMQDVASSSDSDDELFNSDDDDVYDDDERSMRRRWSTRPSMYKPWKPYRFDCPIYRCMRPMCKKGEDLVPTVIVRNGKRCRGCPRCKPEKDIKIRVRPCPIPMCAYRGNCPAGYKRTPNHFVANGRKCPGCPTCQKVEVSEGPKCPLRFCPAVACPRSLSTVSKDANGCPECPRCNWPGRPLVAVLPAESSSVSDAEEADDVEDMNIYEEQQE